MTNSPGAPRHYAWPKYVLSAVALFFTVCAVWTVQEIRRLQRAKADAMDMRSSPASTNGTPDASTGPAR